MSLGSTVASLLGGMSALALLAGCAGAVGIAPSNPSSTKTRAACRALDAALPERAGDQEARDTEPRSRFTAAWGDPPITLRCGTTKPTEYTKTAQLLDINKVAWLPVPQDANVPKRFYAVERAAYVEVVVPKEYSPASDTLVDVGKAIRAHVPKDPTVKP